MKIFKPKTVVKLYYFPMLNTDFMSQRLLKNIKHAMAVRHQRVHIDIF